MFKLQRLEITGFKSFADYTNLVFTGDGITAVVGPNGCGKSNVADAIAWVLGEQRIKHLRGAEMKDVIFQGSRNRSPSGMAEVVLHLVRDETVEHEPDIEDIDSTLEQIDDNAIVIEETELLVSSESAAETTSTAAEANPGELDATQAPAESANQSRTPRTHGKRHWRRHQALEFAPGEAVSVTRRLYRSGESEYLLNDRLCRLRDIQDLFSGTGLSGGHYAIIEQGRIGQILSAKPMDRRTIIEEAAGILKFRKRKEKAERRLDATEGNLLRLTDLLREVRRQLRPLERQADAARRHDGIVAELDAVRLHLAGREIEQLRSRERKRADARGDLAREEQDVRVRLRALDSEVIDAEHALAIPGDDDVADLLARTVALRERSRGLVNLVTERTRGLERELAAVADACRLGVRGVGLGNCRP